MSNEILSIRTGFDIGKIGEKLACDYLKAEGYKIVCTNFKAPIGRNRRGAEITGEIDIVAYDKDCLCFIEVKTRTSEDFASPLAAIDLRKQRQIIRTARFYRKVFYLQNISFRYDAISVVLQNNDAKIKLVKNFFTEERFNRKKWVFPETYF
jgi:putative endonuclease